MSIEYAIIVIGKTRLEKLIERFNTQDQARFYIERQGGNFAQYVEEHDVFHRSLETVQTALTGVVKHKIVPRRYMPAFLFSNKHLIIVLGQDGLVANTAKYAKGRPLVAVNPDKSRYDGVLLPFDCDNFVDGVTGVMQAQFRHQDMFFAQASLNDGQQLMAFNDLFIGAASHVSARYQISFADRRENHSSSGVIVSTRAGATGWLSSIFNMAYGVTQMFEQNLTPKQPKMNPKELLFAVREPFKSVRSDIGITAGLLRQNQQLIIESHMPNNGVIFSDGIEQDFLAFNSGTIATIGLSDHQACLVQPPKPQS